MEHRLGGFLVGKKGLVFFGQPFLSDVYIYGAESSIACLRLRYSSSVRVSSNSPVCQSSSKTARVCSMLISMSSWSCARVVGVMS